MKDFLKIIKGNTKALIGVTIILMFILVAVFAPFLSKYDPQKRTGAPHEYPGFVVKAAQANPDGWVAENLADNARRLRISKDAEHVLGTTAWAVTFGLRLHTARVPHCSLASLQVSSCVWLQQYWVFLLVTSAAASTTSSPVR